MSLQLPEARLALFHEVQLTGLQAQDGPAAIGPRAMLAICLDNAFWFENETGATLAGPGG